MFTVKNCTQLQLQWKLQKKFKYNFFQKNIIIFNTYKKLYLLQSLFLILTKINILTKSLIKIDYLTCKIIKFNKKKLSVILEEIINKFIIKINFKAFNFII